MSPDWIDSAKVALKEGLSDMDYLRSKVVKKPDMVDEKEDDDDEELVKEDNAKDVEEEEGPMQQMDSANESGDKDIQKPPQNKVCSNCCEPFLNIILCQMFGFPFLYCSSLIVWTCYRIHSQTTRCAVHR